jgi:hypothetical protein
MSRKDYVEFAKGVARIDNAEERERAARLIADVCSNDNGRFDYGRFYSACNVQR